MTDSHGAIPCKEESGAADGRMDPTAADVIHSSVFSFASAVRPRDRHHAERVPSSRGERTPTPRR